MRNAEVRRRVMESVAGKVVRAAEGKWYDLAAGVRLKKLSSDRTRNTVTILLEMEAGAARMVGRVLGWLLVCEPPEQSAADLAQALRASKGSISTATRVLLRTGLIERVRVRGERFDRFVAKPEGWDEFLWRQERFSEPRRYAMQDRPGWEDLCSHRRLYPLAARTANGFARRKDTSSQRRRHDSLG